MLAIAVVALGPVTVLGTVLLSAAGEQVAAGGIDSSVTSTVMEATAGIAALAWLVLTAMATIRTVTTVADVDEPAFLLLSTSHRNVVLGVTGAELLTFATWTIPPTLALSSAFAYGAGTILPVVLAPAFVVLLLFTAVPIGFVVGVWIRHLITVYEPIARYRTPILVSVGVAYFAAIAMGWLETITSVLFDLLGNSPLGWPGSLLLLAVPGLEPSVGPLVGTVVGFAVVVPLAVGVGVVSTRIHWYSDPVRSDDEPAETQSSDRLGGLLSGLDRPTRTVTVTAIRRTKRAPVKLLYAVYPLFGAVAFLQDVVRTGTLPSPLAVLFCLYVVWGAGVLFTLNPLGDLGPGLPAVLTSTISGRQAIVGRILAGVLVAVPVGIVVSLVAGAVSPLSLEQTALLLVATVVGAVVGPALAAGVGSLFPRFGSVKVTNDREAVMPSKTAFLVYTLAIALPAAAAAVLSVDAAPAVLAGVLTALLSLAPWFELTISARAITVVASIVLPLGLLAPPLSYRYAVRRFDRYTLE